MAPTQYGSDYFYATQGTSATTCYIYMRVIDETYPWEPPTMVIQPRTMEEIKWDFWYYVVHDFHLEMLYHLQNKPVIFVVYLYIIRYINSIRQPKPRSRFKAKVYK